MNMVVKAGSTSVLLRDALRRPLAELELGGVKAGLRSLPHGVTQASQTLHACTIPNEHDLSFHPLYLFSKASL